MDHAFTTGRQRGNAMVETLVAFLALAPFIAGIPLLGKQLDIKQKTYDATRYAVWERTVWRSDGASNRKAEADITLEARDRTLGSPRAGMMAVDSLRSAGITENPFWRDRTGVRLPDYEDSAVPVGMTYREQQSPVEVGYWLVPGIAYGEGVLGSIEAALLLDSLDLNRRAFAGTTVSVGLRPVLAKMADRPVSLGQRGAAQRDRTQLVHTATGALLSDTWSARNENDMRARIDDLTTNELIGNLELPARIIGLQALGKGRPLYGEGQYSWDPDLRPSSTTLPAAYITRH